MRSKTPQSGFTLMEIIVATTIFVVVFMAMLSLFNYTLKINRRSEALRQATQGMRDFVEYMVKEIRNGQIDYGISDPGATQLSGTYPLGPCYVPGTAITSGTPTYSSQENKLGIINTDGIQECFYYGKADGTYVDTVGYPAQTFSSSTGGSTLVLEKAGISQPQILNPPNSNFKIDNLMFLIRPTKDPYLDVPAGTLAKFSPVVSIFIKFTTKLPTGETVPIYYQTSVSTSQYDIPTQ